MKKRYYFHAALTGLVFLSNMAVAKIYIPAGLVKADTMLNNPAPGFTLKDVDGKSVSLSDFSGKILVIDFWATWCVPCKKSFPAMQMTIDRYKNDPGVKFLFVDTWEKSENYIDIIRKFLAENHYSFHVVLDEKGELGIQNKVYSQYEVKGIPAKFIINRQGIIRYKTGYHEVKSAEEGAKELSDMIEAARNK